MQGTVGNQTAVLRSNNANSSLTIGVKKENMNKRIGSVQFESEVLRKTALHIAKPLMLHTAATQALRFLRFAPRNSQNLMKHQRCGAQKKLVVACAVSLRRTEA